MATVQGMARQGKDLGNFYDCNFFLRFFSVHVLETDAHFQVVFEPVRSEKNGPMRIIHTCVALLIRWCVVRFLYPCSDQGETC